MKTIFTLLLLCGLSYGQTNISVNTVKMKETTTPAGQAGWDMIYGDSSIHRPRFVNNGGSSVTVALLSDNLGSFASTTSAQLLGIISDESGTGSILAANSNTQDSPTFTTKFSVTETTAPTGATGKSVCYADSTAHAFECSYNNGTFGQVVTTNATQTMTAKTLTSPTVSTGISQGSGLKHQRFGATCSTAASVGATCVTTETWTSAFTDSSYTVTCTGVTAGNNAILEDVESITASNFLVRVQQPNAAAAASFAGIDCIAIHD